jgi:3-hydroxyacyl-[acyl-carrier-protein] dehydratase
MNEQVSAARELTAMNIADILKSLPHRYPMLMIDKIIDIDGDNSGIGIKNVTFNEPIFQGHFPENPIFPGVLIIEGMAQTAGAMVIDQNNSSGNAHKHIVLMLGVDKCKFRKPAVPGDKIEYHITKIQRRRNVGRFEARAIVDGNLIAEAEISAMIVEAAQ